jgi:hypothetical protein
VIATNTSVRLTGIVVFWKVREGLGLIASEGRTFYAHASHFICDCGCGQAHKCEIAVGTRVEFTPAAQRQKGRYLHALEIRVKA